MKKIFLIFIIIFSIYNYVNSEEKSLKYSDNHQYIVFKFGPSYYRASFNYNYPDTINILQLSFSLEYNLFINNFITGIGFEHQDIQLYKQKYDPEKIEFEIPYLTVKYLFFNKSYTGSSISYRIGRNASTGSDDSTQKYKNENDFWINFHLGFIIQNEYKNFFLMEIRYGYNLTNNQWKNSTLFDEGGERSKREYSPKSAYDITLYFGGGIKL